jgi:hypothetical protein
MMIGIGMPISHKRTPRMVLASVHSSSEVQGLGTFGAAAGSVLERYQVATTAPRAACSLKAAASSALV